MNDANLRFMICSIKAEVSEVLTKINENGKHTIFVVDEEDKFINVITDGDLRRKILSTNSVSFSITEILKDKPSSVSAAYGTDLNELALLAKSPIKVIPLLDSDGRIVDYYEYCAEFHAPIAMTELSSTELANVSDCIISNWISSQGRYVSEFESKFSAYIGTSFGVSVMNGTVALHLALVALDIGPGDEVILPNLTFAACINAVLYTGATPVLIDIEENSWCLDPELVREAVTSNTKCIMAVHIYGQPCDMLRIMDIASHHNLFVIEDCAEAHGAEFNGVKTGRFGDISCFSFYGNKIVSTGEGGICLTNNPDLDRKMRVLRDHGMSESKRYWHDVVGFNYRMTNLQAAVGVAQLEKIDEVLSRRDEISEWYKELFKDICCLHPQKILPNRKKVTWLVSYQVENSTVERDKLLVEAKTRNIDLRPFFYPLGDMPIYSKYLNKSTPVATKISKSGINLPTITSMSKSDYQEIGKRVVGLFN